MFNCETLNKNNSKGAILVYILGFSALFLILLGALLSFVFFQLQTTKKRVAWHEALNVAESGLDHYKWCLNNGVQNCQTEGDYYDLAGNAIGHFQLEVAENSQCNRLISAKVISTGWTKDFPNIKRKISAFFGRESVAKYAYILNSSVWVGSDEVVRGPCHSNGGIRFDGTNYSTVSSAQQNWVCTASFGCGSNDVGYGLGLCPPECQIINFQCVCPGVFSTTQNSNRGLFWYPIPQFDFSGITADLAQIKSVAQQMGIYLPPARDINPNGKGWHLIFKGDGTLEARIITALSPTYAYSLEEGWHYDYFTIASEFTYQNYLIPPSCSVIFVEDDLWPEGKIKGKVTLASANLVDANKDTKVILEWNLDYSTLDGSDGLTLIGEKNVLIGPDSPNDMILRGIFVAQKGTFSRNYYPINIRNSLTIFGSIISNERSVTTWVTTGGHIISGYLTQENFVDQNLVYSPPPFTPFLSSQFKVINWQEK